MRAGVPGDESESTGGADAHGGLGGLSQKGQTMGSHHCGRCQGYYGQGKLWKTTYCWIVVVLVVVNTIIILLTIIAIIS